MQVSDNLLIQSFKLMWKIYKEIVLRRRAGKVTVRPVLQIVACEGKLEKIEIFHCIVSSSERNMAKQSSDVLVVLSAILKRKAIFIYF